MTLKEAKNTDHAVSNTAKYVARPTGNKTLQITVESLRKHRGKGKQEKTRIRKRTQKSLDI